MRALLASALLVVCAAYDYTAVPGEFCVPPVAAGDEPACNTNADVFLVLDNSQSFYNTHSEVNEWAEDFVDAFALSATSDSRIGIVNFNGCLTCSEEDSATVAHNLTSDRDSLIAAIAARPRTQGKTCISCGIGVAWDQLGHQGRAGAQGVAECGFGSRPGYSDTRTLQARCTWPR